ncbi:hypothetical protein D3C78_1765010 [compost metagenome]
MLVDSTDLRVKVTYHCRPAVQEMFFPGNTLLDIIQEIRTELAVEVQITRDVLGVDLAFSESLVVQPVVIQVEPLNDFF